MALLYSLFFLYLILVPISSSTSSINVLRPDCPDRCGNISIPFPFGTKKGCHLPGFLITCNTSFSPPRSFINTSSMEVISFSIDGGTATVLTSVARQCSPSAFNLSGDKYVHVDTTGYPYVISSTRNKLIGLGCDASANIEQIGKESNIYSHCNSNCNNLSSFLYGSCSGTGCCHAGIPRGTEAASVNVNNLNNFENTWAFSPCNYAFIIDYEQYVFEKSDLADFYKKTKVPLVLDWALGQYMSCVEATNTSIYACGENTYCTNSTSDAPGYHCNCKSGYQGNPYLSNGCQDINECDQDVKFSPCTNICHNIPGSYVCSCPDHYRGDGKKSGIGCYKRPTKFPLVQVVVGSGLGLLFLSLGGLSIYWVLKKRRMMRLREKFFLQNGGLLLQKELVAHEGMGKSTRIFTADELKGATENFSDSRILGHGGNGTVYKGILRDTNNINRVIAIKKSHVADATQIEQFVNEVVLLSQVIHKHVVRILGCCLETQLPLLVYEYVSNGTLHNHLHGRHGSLSWEARLRIAAETADALAYLHSAIARPIFHRDVKAANILLDENYMAKVSDFGASRLIPLNREQITTLVQGTLGYLDPEYFHSGQMTEKSDVYSFGVVLAEVMTGQKPLSSERQPQEQMNLAKYFVMKMKEGLLLEILEPRVRNEGCREQVEALADIARRCLKLKGEERPTMKEVAAEIEAVRMLAGRNAGEPAAEEEKLEVLYYEEEEAGEETGTTYFTGRNLIIISDQLPETTRCLTSLRLLALFGSWLLA